MSSGCRIHYSRLYTPQECAMRISWVALGQFSADLLLPLQTALTPMVGDVVSDWREVGCVPLMMVSPPCVTHVGLDN